MKIKFEKLTIEHFKGIKSLIVNFGENQTIIKGANETGKTTVADAIAYVLTGKNSLGESTFDLLPIGKENVSASVKLDLTLDDGNREKPVTLSREYLAQTNKNKEYTGEYKTVCTINGILTGPRDFDKWIADNICKPEIFRLIHDVRYFTENIQGNGKEKAWEAQRRILMSIYNVDDDYTYAKAHDGYKELLDGLARYDSASQYLVYLKSKEKECEKQITEHNRNIAFIETSIAHNSGRSVDEIQKDIDSLKNDENVIRESIGKDIEKKKDEIWRKIKVLEKEYNKNSAEQKEKQRILNAKRAGLNADKQSLQAELLTAKNVLKAAKVENVCHSCGQKLPPEMIEKQKNYVKDLEDKIHAYETDIAILDSELKSLQEDYQAVEYPQEIIDLNMKITNLELSSFQMKSSNTKIEEISTKIDSLKEELFKAKEVEKYQSDIAERKAFLAAALDDRANTRRLIDMCSQFIQKKCKAITDQVNGMFDGITFNMFRFNKTNDEMKECCDIFFNGVPYQSLSYSTKFYVSLKIVLGFQKFYNISMPLIIDNSESIDLWENLNVQTIKLVKVVARCPKCESQESSRRNADGTWTCKTCGNAFLKALEIETI